MVQVCFVLRFVDDTGHGAQDGYSGVAWDEFRTVPRGVAR